MLAFAVSRFVHPVEAVKEMLQLVLRNLIAVIDHAQNSVVPLALQRDSDLIPGRMADRVIQQNGHQLCALCFAACKDDI